MGPCFFTTEEDQPTREAAQDEGELYGETYDDGDGEEFEHSAAVAPVKGEGQEGEDGGEGGHREFGVFGEVEDGDFGDFACG